MADDDLGVQIELDPTDPNVIRDLENIATIVAVSGITFTGSGTIKMTMSGQKPGASSVFGALASEMILSPESVSSTIINGLGGRQIVTNRQLINSLAYENATRLGEGRPDIRGFGDTIEFYLDRYIEINGSSFVNLSDFIATLPADIQVQLSDNAREFFGLDPRTECFGGETPIDMWPLDPEFTPDPSNPHKVFDQDAVRAKIWKKPISMIRKGDIVVSFDKYDNLVPGTVSKTFENESKIVLDYFGTRVTPGHVYYRPDSKKADKFECLLDILRDDGMIQDVEGNNIRAATNVPVGDPRDGFVWAVTQERKYGVLFETNRGRIRLGTRFIVDGTTSQCVADVIEAQGGTVGNDELIHVGTADPQPFVWEHGTTLPKPEDFVLQASSTTVEEIYKAGEWETRRPQMPTPMVKDGGPVQPLSATALSAVPRNQPLNLQSAQTSAPKSTARPPMNRKQRKAMEAKQRKAAKVGRKVAV